MAQGRGPVTTWYVPEANSAGALAVRNRFNPPSALTHAHRTELQKAWQLKVYRKEMSPEAAARAAENLQADIDAGVWLLPDYDLDSVSAVSVRLAREDTATLGTRSLDVLHVAAALALRERHFVKGDERQARLAAAVGLRVTRP